jgi:CHAT domain-containing protein
MSKSNRKLKSGSPGDHSRPAGKRDFDLSLAESGNPLTGETSETNAEQPESSLRVTISNGDLFYAKYPLIAGHFEDDGILYAEKIIDGYLNKALSRQHQLRIYPGPVGTSKLFSSGQAGFKGAIIVGLGMPEDLTASELTKTVEQGAADYLLQLNSHAGSAKSPDEAGAGIGLSSLIVGCGYAGLSIENSLKAIIQGVQNANGKVRNLKLKGARVIEHIEFVELFEDKAVSSLYSLCRMEKNESRLFRISMEEKRINTLAGSKKRIPIEREEGWWNRITVTKKASDDKTIRCLNFSTSTASSQEKEQELPTTPILLEETIEGMSTNNQWTPERAKAIFELLIPNDFKDQLRRHGNIDWILDEYTASYPWELLQDSLSDTNPMCVSGGMIRQLKDVHYRAVVRTTEKNNALVVADPDLQGFANQLPGALKEGKLVAEMLKDRGMNTTTSFKGNHSEIIEKLFRDDYKIIHLSGHGIFNQDPSLGSGMVIGRNLFLSTREISQMSCVPELVFVNCCHLGKIQGDAEEFYQQRYKLAANIGTQLIENGVKCVIAAGWAVNDDAATEFAKIFYDRMFKGYTFGESITEARMIVYEMFGSTNTWGAYQCYGDPFYKFRHIQRDQKIEVKTYLIAQEAEVDLENLLNESETGRLPSGDYLKKLKEISKAVDDAHFRNSLMTEREALIYLDLREYDQAGKIFSSLSKTEDAAFLYSVLGNLYNARAKKIPGDSKHSQKNYKQYIDELNKIIENIKNQLINK